MAAPAMHRTRLIDVQDDPSLTSLMDLLASLHRSADPRDAIAGLLGSMRPAPTARAFAHVIRENHHYVVRRMKCLSGQELGAPASLGALCDLLATPTPKIAQDLDLSDQPTLCPYRSAIALPLFNGDAADDWVLLLDERPGGLTAEDLRELVVRLQLVTVTANSLRIERQLFQANLKIQQELESLAVIQKGLLPERIPDIPGLSIAASYEAVTHAGGDIYDFVPLGQRPGHSVEENDARWAILIGDVAGHGAPAAIVMAMLHSILHAYPSKPEGPAEVLAFANRHLASKRIRQTFVTAMLAFYDPATRVLTYTRAGQTPGLLITPGQTPAYKYLDAVGDLPLGLMPDELFTQASIQLRPGQTVLWYTDGITETKGRGGVMFETSGLETALLFCPPDPRGVIQAVHSAVARHSEGREAVDDRTLVAIHVE